MSRSTPGGRAVRLIGRYGQVCMLVLAGKMNRGQNFTCQLEIKLGAVNIEMKWEIKVIDRMIMILMHN